MSHNELEEIIRNWLNKKNFIKHVTSREKMILCGVYQTYIKPDVIAVDIDGNIYAIECETLKGDFMKKIRLGFGHAIVDKIFFNYIYLAYPEDEYNNEIKGRELFEKDFKCLINREGIGLLMASENKVEIEIK